MNRPEIVHIAPKNEAWRVYRAGYDTELSFEDLGQALDAASAMVNGGRFGADRHPRESGDERTRRRSARDLQRGLMANG